MRVFETTNFFDSIIVIQSLLEDESQTGLILSRDTLFLECSLNETSFSYVACNNRDEFFTIFKKIELNLIGKNNDILGGNAQSPILHFEIHGTIDKSGLILKNNQLVGWSEFDDCCRSINRITQNNLLVVMAVCNGYYAAAKAHMSKLTPFYALIGPTDTIYVKDIKKIFPVFYRYVFSSGNLLESFKMVREYCNLFHCEIILMKILTEYFLKHCEGQELDRRVQSIMKQREKIGKKKISPKEIINQLKPSENIFQKYKRTFLMTGASNNTDRFSLRFEDVQENMAILRENFT